MDQREPAWTVQETSLLLDLVSSHDEDWDTISTYFAGKSPDACSSWFNFLDVSTSYFTKRKKQKAQQQQQPRKRRKANQIERLYKCLETFCNRSYGTEGALKMHIKIKHPGVPYNETYQQQARKAAATLTKLGYEVPDCDDAENGQLLEDLAAAETIAAREEAANNINSNYEAPKQIVPVHETQSPNFQMQRNITKHTPQTPVPQPPMSFQPPRAPVAAFEPTNNNNNIQNPTTYVPSDLSILPPQSQQYLLPKKRSFQDVVHLIANPALSSSSSAVPVQSAGGTPGGIPAKRFKPTVIGASPFNPAVSPSSAPVNGAFFRFESRAAPNSFRFITKKNGDFDENTPVSPDTSAPVPLAGDPNGTTMNLSYLL